MLPAILCLIIVVTGLGGLCRAGENAVRPAAGEFWCFPDTHGTWEVTSRSYDSKTFGLSPDQTARYRSKIEKLSALLQSAKVFNPPLGFKAEVWHGTAGSAHPFKLAKTCASHPVPGRLWIQFLYYFTTTRNGKPSTFSEHRTEAEFYFNDPYTVFNASLGKLPDGRTMAYQPYEWRKVNGATIYFNQHPGGDLYIFLTKGGKLPWVPVSQEQYMTALLGERKADLPRDEELPDLPEVRAAMAKAKAFSVDGPEAQLKSMSAAERAAQAWVSGAGEPVVPKGTKYARPVVALDPGILNLSRPRTDIQLITVRLEGIPLDGPQDPLKNCLDVVSSRLLEFVNQVDWAKVAAFID